VARAFISAPLDEQTKKMLLQLDRSQADVKWIEPEQWHITMQFFDAVNLDELRDRFAKIEAAQTIGALGPRVAQFGDRYLVVPVQGLSRLAENVRQSTGRLAPKQQLPFVGHITLGRTKSDIVPNLAGVTVQGNFRVERLMLMESVIGSTGATHTLVDSTSLIPLDVSAHSNDI
tara:strand:- start:647 stop:1168 length:522 start_codon:yes stop_codon:yes gene_type:complete